MSLKITSETTFLLGLTNSAQYGPELLDNGNFSAGTGADADDWTEASGVERTDSGGGQYVMRISQPGFAGGSAISQLGKLTIGVTYRVEYTISNYSAGTTYCRLGTANGTSRTANGTYTEDVTCAGATTFYIYGITGSEDLDIDNVSVKQVL
jgi:hypothetical protein